MTTGKEIALEAKKKGICKEWFAGMLKMRGIKPLCEMYFTGSDWAMEHDFPSVDLLRRFIGNSEKHGLFTDYTGEIREMQNIALFGKSRAEIIAKAYDVKEIYIRHKSVVNIRAEDKAYLVINLLDEAKLHLECATSAKAVIYCYGKPENITSTGGNIKVLKRYF